MFKPGFTIVELMVVITIIGILTGVGVIATIELQKDTRDNQRQSDMAIMSNELDKFYEKYGEYPAGCQNNCNNWFFTGNVSSGGALITPTATIDQIRNYLPAVHRSINDPRATSPSTPFNVQGGYFYFGGTVNTSPSVTSSISNLTQYSDSSPSIRCSVRSVLAPGQSGSYVLGYYSETENRWVLKHGRYGTRIDLFTGGDPSCSL